MPTAMNNEEGTDILIEALEVFFNHILYVRELYPPQIFKKRRAYNTTIYVSIFPPLNTYLYKVLRTARELRQHGELQQVELLVFQNEWRVFERYVFDMEQQLDLKSLQAADEDEFLLQFEEQLRASLYKLAERLKPLQKLPQDAKFKVLLHTTQAGFVRLSQNSQYQEFPWLQDTLRNMPAKGEISLLPLTAVNNIGLQLMAEILHT